MIVLGLSPEALAQTVSTPQASEQTKAPQDTTQRPKTPASKTQYAPRLVVAITIDQLRTDYLEAFSPLYGTQGFKRLLSQGVVFSNASYPFQPIDRASAVTTVMTGVTPY